MIGWYDDSIGYCSNDGYCYNSTGYGVEFGPSYGTDLDISTIIGCGFNTSNKKSWAKSTIIFIKNTLPITVSL